MTAETVSIEAAPRSWKESKVGHFVWKFGPAIALVAICIGLWELLIRVLDVPEYLWPAPSLIAATLRDQAGDLAAQSWTTLQEVILGFLIALLAGAMIPTQAATNNKMAAFVDNPVLAAFVSFLVGTVALFVYLLLTGVPLSNLSSVRDAPLIAWAGGFFGAFFVAAGVTLVPRIGVAMTFTLIIAGQMLVSIIIDHFGFLGLEVRPVSWQRIAAETAAMPEAVARASSAPSSMHMRFSNMSLVGLP